jgi:uncharacterized membrane protein
MQTADTTATTTWTTSGAVTAREAGAALSGRGEQTALLVASAVIPQSFEPSLVARSTLDQGLVTGLSATLSYLVTVTTQDVLESAAAAVSRRAPADSWWANNRNTAVLLDLAALPAGVLAQLTLPRRPGERVIRGLVRQASWRLAVTGLGGATFGLIQAGTQRLDGIVGARGWIARFPVAVPAGFLVGVAVDAQQRRKLPDEPSTGEIALAHPVKAAGTGVGITVAVSAAAFAEHLIADSVGALLSAKLPGPNEFWKLAGHGLCLSGVVVAGRILFGHTIEKIEAGTTAVEPLLDDEAAHRWIGPTSSGSAESLVPWDTLGREGRRHTFTYVRPHPVADRPPGFPDLSIETVMSDRARATPIQVYVGLDSAPTAAERVELALAEMDRTQAWERSLLMLISPTGTGYVNYCAVAATQYLTRGDLATVTLQYSKRPSPLSLFKVADAREQNRLLWLRISDRVRRLEGRRPRVVLFGESLGAHTSQDVLLHWGTLGPQALGIERALWIGTPYSSGWMHQVTGAARPDVDPALITTVNDFGQIEAMSPEQRAGLRYVMVSHDNDGVTKFGADLIATRPRWLTSERPPVEIIAGYSPRGIPARMRWRPLTTFLQSMVDMKNAQIPGAFRAWAHDYRPDLTRFISEVFDLPASPEQLSSIEAALEKREALREQILSSEVLDATAAAESAAPEPAAKGG